MKRAARRVAVAVVGTLLLLVGVAMLVLPGPGALVIAAGIGVLATEFAWARRLRVVAARRAQRAADRLRRWRG